MVLMGCAGNIEHRKKQSQAARDVGESYLIQGNYTPALRELLKAEKIYPDDPILQDFLGLAYRGKEHFEEAAAHFKKAVELEPEYAPALNNLGETYLIQKKWDEAIQIFKELSANILYSTPHFADLNLGWAYYNKHDFVTSAVYYKKVIKHYLDGFNKDLVYVKALRGLGKIHLASGQLEKAEKLMEEALALAPNFPPLLMDIAKIRSVMGKKEQAIAAYRKVIEVAPGSELAVEAIKSLSVLAPGKQ
jgi:Tfp pilus assembly protein PilF